MFRLFLFLMFLFVPMSFYADSENIDIGKSKSFVCFTCHGNDGNSVVPIWPKLAGQFPKYLIKQLEDFKKGESGLRFEPIMYEIVKELSSTDFFDIASYFFSQKISENIKSLDVNKLGKKIYLAGDLKRNIVSCSSCHGVLGEGSEFANVPKLRHQHSNYISNQLQKYKSKVRNNDYSNIMKDISFKMTDEEILAVSEYISKL